MARLRSGQPDQAPDARGRGRARLHGRRGERVRPFSGSAVIGGPETVRAGLEELAESTAADELMITTMVHDHADRIRTYEGLAELFELSPEPR